MNCIRIAANNNCLARVQSEMVGDALGSVHTNADLQIEFVNSDQCATQALIDGKADIAVHSWKDLPADCAEATEIVGTLPRADMRDLILFRRDSIAASKNRISVLSSSSRRSSNLEQFLRVALPFKIEEVIFTPIEGDIETRLKTLMEGKSDALVVAKAAIDRLLGSRNPALAEVQALIRKVLDTTKFIVVPLTVSPSAAGQGAIAIEARKNDSAIKSLVQAISCADSFSTGRKERELLKSFGNGCDDTAVGATILNREYGDVQFIKGLNSSGESIESTKIERKKPLPRAVELSKIYISKRNDAKVSRVPESLGKLDINSPALIFCAKHSAWPEGFTPPDGSVVWTAGLKTWEQLAKRGVWVSGSSESLGEHEDPRIESLHPDLKRRIKFTHVDAARKQSESTHGKFETVGTYKLEPIASSNTCELPAGCSHYYWRSSDEFLAALDAMPAIAAANHGCGPGRSFETIAKSLSSAGKVAPFLSADEFLEEVKPL